MKSLETQISGSSFFFLAHFDYIRPWAMINSDLITSFIELLKPALDPIQSDDNQWMKLVIKKMQSINLNWSSWFFNYPTQTQKWTDPTETHSTILFNCVKLMTWRWKMGQNGPNGPNGQNGQNG